jgi:hypothetical protein
MEQLLICVRPVVVGTPVLVSSASSVDGSTKSADTPASIDLASPVGLVQDLLSTLSAALIVGDGSSKGQCLLDASSEPWRGAIYQVGRDVKKTQGVARALLDAMACPNNWFAILTDRTEQIHLLRRSQ